MPLVVSAWRLQAQTLDAYQYSLSEIVNVLLSAYPYFLNITFLLPKVRCWSSSSLYFSVEQFLWLITAIKATCSQSYLVFYNICWSAVSVKKNSLYIVDISFTNVSWLMEFHFYVLVFTFCILDTMSQPWKHSKVAPVPPQNSVQSQRQLAHKTP